MTTLRELLIENPDLMVEDMWGELWDVNALQGEDSPYLYFLDHSATVETKQVIRVTGEHDGITLNPTTYIGASDTVHRS